MDARVLETLRELLPGNTFVPKVSSWGEELELPIPEGADYGFVFYEYNNSSERQIAARRRGAAEKEYFWYVALDYGTPEAIAAEYRDAVRRLLMHETRIIQRKGILFWHFRCEALIGEGWKRVSGNSVVRGAAKPPSIKGRRCTYTSPPLAVINTKSRSLDSGAEGSPRPRSG